MAVNLNIRDGTRFNYTLGQRPQLTLTADVTGLSGSNAKMLLDAYQASGMLKQGSVVPGVANFVVTSIDGGVIGPDRVRFTLTAEERPGFRVQINRKEETKAGLIQIGSSLSTTVTERDKDGEPLTVTFIPDGGEPDIQGVKAEIVVPQSTRRIERVEIEPDLTLADKFMGSVNSRRIWGREERTLLVREIQFVSRDGGATWNGSYEFQYRPETWDSYVVHEDAETGAPTVGVSLANGIERKRLLRETDFSRIGVTFPR